VNEDGEAYTGINYVEALGRSDYSSRLAGSNTLVDQNGAFEIKDLPTGSYYIMGMKAETGPDGKLDANTAAVPYSSEPNMYQVKDNAVTDVGSLMVKE